MAKVLVTGASGFIGRRLAARLKERGDKVHCLVRKDSKVEPLQRIGAQLKVGDITDPASLASAVKDMEIVFHLAGAVFVRRRRDFLRINEGGAASMARACSKRSSPPVLVYISSLAVAGPSSPDQPHSETDPPAPISLYGKSKWAAEQRLAEMADRLPITIVRPPIVFGPGDPHLLKLFRSVKIGWNAIPGWKVKRLSLAYVDDLIEVLLRAAERGQRLSPSNAEDSQFTGVYYIAHREQPTYTELGELIAQALQSGLVRRAPIPKPLCFVAAGVIECVGVFMKRPRVLNIDKMREATSGSWICRTERVEQELGFSPPLSLAERLRETAQWYREQGAL